MDVHLSNLACLIPARKGSTRVTEKNIANFAGKPLMLWTIEAALKANLTNIFLTTNYLPSELGFKMPEGIEWISRPKEYCTENAKYDMYIRHFLGLYPQFRAVVLLQPTSPLRTKDDINNALEIYSNSKRETLVSAYRVPHRQKVYKPNGHSMYGTQLLEGNNHLFVRNSAVYIFSRKYFETHNSIFARDPLIYEMPIARSIDVDTQLDFNYAQRMIKYKSGGIDDEREFNISSCFA